MITLGIGKSAFRRQKEPVQAIPEALTPAIRQTLSEAIAWCKSQIVLGGEYRSAALDPSEILNIPSLEELGIDAWVQAKRQSYQRAVSDINQKRSALLRDANVSVFDNAFLKSKGKLLSYEPLETVTDGAAEYSSLGYFDIEDAPPWDNWFLYSRGTIFSWVPESLIEITQAGIKANPVDCIHWSKWAELSGDS